jgi:hypothetical protein
MTDQPEKSAYERLNAQRRKFVDFIVQGYTQTDAVREISRKWTRPDLKASKWRKEKLVQQAIEERQTEAMEDAGITNAQILLGIAALARVSPKALVWLEGETLPQGATVGQPKKLHQLDDVTARCIQSIEYSKDGEIKVRFPDRIAARKLLGQYKRLFTESHEINLGEKTLEQLVEASWNRSKPPTDDTPPAAGL